MVLWDFCWLLVTSAGFCMLLWCSFLRGLWWLLAGFRWVSVAFVGFSWLRVDFSCSGWLLVAVAGFHWLFVASGGFRYFLSAFRGFGGFSEHPGTAIVAKPWGDLVGQCRRIYNYIYIICSINGVFGSWCFLYLFETSDGSSMFICCFSFLRRSFGPSSRLSEIWRWFSRGRWNPKQLKGCHKNIPPSNKHGSGQSPGHFPSFSTLIVFGVLIYIDKLYRLYTWTFQRSKNSCPTPCLIQKPWTRSRNLTSIHFLTASSTFMQFERFLVL